MEKNDALLERIRILTDSIILLSESDKRREQIELLLDQIEAVLNQKLLTKEDQEEYFRRLDKMIRPRFGNYKKPCPLKIHYSSKVDGKILELVEKGYFPCSGTCSPEEESIPCRNNLIFDPLQTDLVVLEFDHWLEKSEIYEEMRKSLENLILTEEFLSQFPLAQYDPAYVKKYFRDPPANARNRAIYKLVESQINLDLYRDDLYGSNIKVRCKLCHNACKSSSFHPSIKRGRYLFLQASC